MTVGKLRSSSIDRTLHLSDPDQNITALLIFVEMFCVTEDQSNQAISSVFGG